MKLAHFEVGQNRLLGLIEEQCVTNLTGRVAGLGADMIDLIGHWDQFSEAILRTPRSADYDLSEIRLLAPVPRPGKVLGIGLNYADHIREAGIPRPEHQIWFSKAVTSVNGPFDPIERPIVSTELDYEAELVMVVGRRSRHIPLDQAYEAIFGYCVGNDVSVRDWQRQGGQHMIGKSFDTHAPYGPFIVTSDEISPRALSIRSYVNGEKRQDSNTSHLIFDCAAQLAHLSHAMTLEPGDVIFTGTPGGVGAAMNPPRFLAPGDRVRVEIDEIGFIENRVVDEHAPA